MIRHVRKGLPKDTNNITPLTLHLDFRHIQTRIQDHIALLASNAEWHAGIKPSDYDKRSIVIATAFSADSIEYLDIRNQQATRILDSRFISELFPNDPLHWNLNFNPHTFFQQWDTKGILTFSHIRSFSQHLPLRFTINATQLGFRNNELILDKAQMKLGSSDFLVSGKLLTEKLPNAHRRFVKGNLNIQSHFLDINELNRALWQGEVVPPYPPNGMPFGYARRGQTFSRAPLRARSAYRTDRNIRPPPSSLF